jgi:cytochrome c-type biogenesis protein CcmH
MRKFLGVLLGAWLLAVGAPSLHGADRTEEALDYRTAQIANELRCLVCQNQTIADSHADLAVDLKNEIKRMLKEGKSEEEIKAYMVQRYGDFVLYRPPVKSTTLLLWAGPLVFLVVALVVVFLVVRKRPTAAVQLSEAEHDAAARLLEGSESKRT